MFTFTGTVTDHGNRPLAGAQLIIQPDPEITLDPDGKVTRVGGRTVTANEDGHFSVQLATGEGLTYTVRSTAGGALPPRRFAAPADGETVDLSDPAHFPVPSPSPMTPMVRGASAYDVWLAQGNTGSEADFLESLRGTDGLATITASPNGNGTTTLTGA